jgi:hypothetical protein
MPVPAVTADLERRLLESRPEMVTEEFMDTLKQMYADIADRIESSYQERLRERDEQIIEIQTRQDTILQELRIVHQQLRALSGPSSASTPSGNPQEEDPQADLAITPELRETAQSMYISADQLLERCLALRIMNFCPCKPSMATS